MADKKLTDLERQIAGLTQQLNELRKASTPEEIPNYTFATLNGDAELVKVLIDKGAGVDARNKGGTTPLGFAVTNGDVEIASLLIASR